MNADVSMKSLSCDQSCHHMTYFSPAPEQSLDIVSSHGYLEHYNSKGRPCPLTHWGFFMAHSINKLLIKEIASSES